MRNPMVQMALFAAGVLIPGLLIGWLFQPGLWYEQLEKPAFNPPAQVFGPAWAALCVLIGITGWRVWNRAGDPGLRALWSAQLALNFAWSPVFFGLGAIGAALAVVSLLLVTIVLFILRARLREPVSALLFLPYLLWVSFAAILNAAVLRLN
ncbi:TspO/MBR family protein [Pseudogemmobacter humi]|uniref:TspO/MBR family protein n=1 Tax=Pseudogemmobacter humi TaxID=2483812 RepID=A0A3P5XE47_9RHOB|nr:TspO/MBR family protein [Pseudogemmobacter humi]VDC32997.1 TspO/MBR family protein [Pseudogemmobacter humi]